jgi:hypothetical protein
LVKYRVVIVRSGKAVSALKSEAKALEIARQLNSRDEQAYSVEPVLIHARVNHRQNTRSMV